MSLNPFSADPVIRERIERLKASIGDELCAEIHAILSVQTDTSANLGGVLEKAAADALIAKYDLTGVEDLMLLALAAAQQMSLPPISDFRVGAIGLEYGTGNLIFGGNVEFPGTHMGYTIHAEGFVFTRAFSRRSSIAVIAIGEAHPCAHCRQYLSEFAASKDLQLIDPLGHRLTLQQLYPWPFDPEYLGQPGAIPGKKLWTLRDTDRHLVARGERSHTPYSKCPAAIVLTLTDGSTVSGAAIESVAFNPAMGPLQAALIDLLAHRRDFGEIVQARLGTVVGGTVDHSMSVDELLGKVAPLAELTIIGWAP